MPGKKYTEEQINQVLELRERGLSYGQVAIKTGVHYKSVQRYCLHNGVDAPGEPMIHKGPPEYFRNGKKVTFFTPEEDALIVKWDMEGMFRSEMAKRLNRAPSSIKNRLASLARQEARKEAA